MLTLYAASMLSITFSSVIIAFYTFLKSKTKPISVSVLISFTAVSVWAMGRFLILYAPSEEIALKFAVFSYSGSIIMPLAFLVLTYYLIESKPPRLLILILSIFCIMLLLLNFNGQIISSLSPKMMFPFYDNPDGRHFEFFSNYYTFLLLYIFFILIKSLFVSTGKKRNRIAFFLVAFTIGFLPSSTTFFLVHDIQVFPFGVPIIAFFPLILSYAITKEHLFDISVVIKKIPSYIITSILIVPLFLVISFLLHENLMLLMIANATLGLLTAFLGRPLQELIVTTARHVFVKGYYDQDSLINETARTLTKEDNRENIPILVENVLDNHINFDQTACIIKTMSDESASYRLRTVDSDGNALNTSIPKDNPLLGEFIESFSVIRVSELNQPSQVFLKQLKFTAESILIPLHSPEGLDGIVILGKRSSGKSFGQSDFDGFNTIINVVNSVLYRLTPQEKIEEKYFLTQKQLHDAEIQLLRNKKNEALAHYRVQFAHELRTPLSIINMTAESLPDSDELKEAKDDILEEVKNAAFIIDETLRLSSSDDVLDEQIKAEVDINDSLKRCIDVIPKHHFKLVTDFQSVPSVLGVYRDIQIMFTNLVKNAVEAMPHGGTITIKTYSKARFVFIEIKDNGKGIPEENKDKIWKPYISGNQKGVTGNDTAQRGWGLTIVQRIVTEHNGHIEFKNNRGKGVTFIIRLPLSSNLKKPTKRLTSKKTRSKKSNSDDA